MSLNLLGSVIVNGLAAWRVSHMLVYESGPFNVFVKFREKVGIEHDESGLPIKWPSANVFGCVMCLSVWFSFVFIMVPAKISKIFAIAGVAAFLESHNGES